MVRKFLKRGVVSNSSNLQAEGLPLVDGQRLLIQYIRSYPPYWRSLIHLQPGWGEWHIWETGELNTGF